MITAPPPRFSYLLVATLACLTGASVAAGASPDAGCLPKPALPVPVCLPAANAEEEGILTMKQAQGLVAAQHWAEVETLLIKQLPSLQRLGDLGLLVQAHAMLGEARMAVGKDNEATQAFEQAANLWSNVAALQWIRTLSSGEAGQQAVRDASSAAASAAFRIAEIWHNRNSIPLPDFVGPSTSDFDSVNTLPVSAAERKRRTAEKQRLREAVQAYLDKSIRPWLERQRAILGVAERKYTQVLLMAPVVSPYWRIAVAAKTGLLWGQFVRDTRRVMPQMPRWYADDVPLRYTCITGDDPTESYQQ